MNVTISEVDINNSTGAGLLGINMLGLSNISQTTLSGNKPNCFLIFLDVPSTLQAISSTLLTIEDSHVMFGKLPHNVGYSSWCATGLGIMLAQVTYNVHICINRIKTYRNMNKWNCSGNLHFTIERWACYCSSIQAKEITSVNIFNKTTLPRGDITEIDLEYRGYRKCTCSTPAEEKYIVHILESYFVGVSIWMRRSKKYVWHANTKIKFQNITVKNCTAYPAMYISDIEYIEMDNMTFTHNHENEISLYHTYIVASGRCCFVNNTGVAGILYVSESRIFFNGEVEFIGNKAQGATVILARESTMEFQKTAKLVDNQSRVGGAIALYDNSRLIVGKKGSVTFLRNYAQQDGGAILVGKSEIVVKYGAIMTFTENKAYNGGALALQNGARLNFESHGQIIFVGNYAQQYGGALYVEEPVHKIVRNNHVYWILCFF